MIELLIVLVAVAIGATSIAITFTLLRLRRELATQRQRNASHVSPSSPSIPLVKPQTATLPESELDWMSSAADEIRMPLEMLRNQAETLRQHIDYTAPPVFAPAVDRMLQQINRIEQTIDAWRSTRFHNDAASEAPQPTDLLLLARMVSARMTSMTDPPCDVADGPQVWAFVVPASIEEALGTVIRMARRAAPQMVIDIVVREMAYHSEKAICLAVADRREYADVQVTADEQTELLSVQQMIARQGGWLTTETRAGGGRITTLWLPAEVIIPLGSPQPSLASQPLRPSGR